MLLVVLSVSKWRQVVVEIDPAYPQAFLVLDVLPLGIQVVII